MTPRMAVAAIVMIVVAFAAGCASERPSDSERPSGGPTIIGLRTTSADECSGVGQSGVLHGDSSDPEVVWEEPLVGPGPRTNVIWPTGYRAVFDPTLAILDEQGRPVLREGDYVDGGCVTGVDAADPLLLIPPFLAFRLECGPMPVQHCIQRVTDAGRNANAERHPVAVLRFLNDSGKYRAFYEDGTTADGVILMD
jgi:hypothetical protein